MHDYRLERSSDTLSKVGATFAQASLCSFHYSTCQHAIFSLRRSEACGAWANHALLSQDSSIAISRPMLGLLY